MMRYPELTEQIRTEINDRIRRSLKSKDHSSAQCILTLNIYASKERKKSRIKCLKDRLRYLQGKYLIHKNKLEILTINVKYTLFI